MAPQARMAEAPASETCLQSVAAVVANRAAQVHRRPPAGPVALEGTAILWHKFSALALVANQAARLLHLLLLHPMAAASVEQADSEERPCLARCLVRLTPLKLDLG